MRASERRTEAPKGEAGFMQDDFPLIKRAVLILAGTIGLSILLLAISSFALSSQQVRRNLAQQQFDARPTRIVPKCSPSGESTATPPGAEVKMFP